MHEVEQAQQNFKLWLYKKRLTELKREKEASLKSYRSLKDYTEDIWECWPVSLPGQHHLWKVTVTVAFTLLPVRVAC